MAQENLLLHFPTGIKFVDQAMEQKQKILVHCMAGQSRSASMVLAYLITKQGMTLSDALMAVRQKRPSVMPNPGFIKNLEQL